MSSLYCNQPYRTVHFNEAGQPGPCCTFRGQRSHNLHTIEDYLASDWLQQVKTDLNTGIWPTGCKQCKTKEDRGESSHRIDQNNKWGYEDTGIKELWISFGNTCNKTCNICRPQRSNLIAKEYKKIGTDNFWLQDPLYSGKKYELALQGKVSRGAFLQLDHYKSIIGGIDRLVFDGGEPTIVNQFNEVLEYMVNEGYTDTEILVGTNGSLTEYQLNLLDNFKRVEFHLSIDGVRELYQVVRTPHDWDWWTEHHDRIKQHDIQITYACVAHALNVHQLPEILEYFWEQPGDFYFSTLNSHNHLGCDLVPEEVITEVIDKLEKFDKQMTNKEQNNLINIISHLKNRRDYSSEYNLKSFQSWLSVMPEIKGIDYQAYIPWNLKDV